MADRCTNTATLYVLGARVVHRLGGTLQSTLSPSELAKATWQRLANAGWATVESDSFKKYTGLGMRYPDSPPPSVFTFTKENQKSSVQLIN